jgi:hypothetical protein
MAAPRCARADSWGLDRARSPEVLPAAGDNFFAGKGLGHDNNAYAALLLFGGIGQTGFSSTYRGIAE